MENKSETVVLVTGASGFIANQLILDLLDQGYKVRGTVRSKVKGEILREALRAHSPRADEIELVEADLESDDGWPEAVAGVDVIQHLASPFPLGVPKNADDLIRPAREGALRVLRAANAAGVTRVIMTSSFAAIGYGHPDPIKAEYTEADWSDPSYSKDCPPYPASKTLAEQAAWDYVQNEGKGIQLTTINPVMVLGPIRSAMVKTSVGVISQMMAGKYPMLPDVGLQAVDVRDVSAAHIAAMQNPATIGERYLLADAFYSMKEIATLLRETFPDYASKISTRRMPSVMVKIIAMCVADMKTIALELGKRRCGSSEKIRALLGRDLISTRDAVLASAESLIRYDAI